jgi:hypothetical protein
MAAVLRSRDAPGREIGPIGTVSRIVAGILAITVPVALEGTTWWDLAGVIAAGLVAAAAARLITTVFERGAPAALERRHAICSPAGCALIGVLYAATFALGSATPAHGDVAFWGFLGASMLLAAIRGDAGCEVLTVPNAITGRDDRIGCILFTPIDAAETRRRNVSRGYDPRRRAGRRRSAERAKPT